MYTHTHTHTYIHTYTHVHTYTYTYTQTVEAKFSKNAFVATGFTWHMQHVFR